MIQVKNFLYSSNTILVHKNIVVVVVHKNIVVVIVHDRRVVQKEELHTYKYCDLM